MSNIVLFSKKIQCFSGNEILNMLPDGVLVDLKLKDPHPFLQLYSLCHEGTSTPKVLGESNPQPITWTRKAIQSIKNIALKGLKLFKLHNEDSSTENRPNFGEIIHSFEKEIDGKLHHCVITYHTPDQAKEAKNIDVISQEGKWNIFEKAGQLFADTVDYISGIAGASSNEMEPAFPGAKKLAYIQAFSVEKNTEENEHKGEKGMTFHEWLEMKKNFLVYPNQLFSEEELRADRKFGQYFEQLDKLKVEHENLKKDYEKKLESLTGEVDSYKKEKSLLTANDRVKKLISESKVTDEIKTFVEKSFDREKNSIQNLDDENLKNFVETKIGIYQEVLNEVKPKNNKSENSSEDQDNMSDDQGNANEINIDNVDLNDFLM